jgi:hypothetical protein
MYVDAEQTAPRLIRGRLIHTSRAGVFLEGLVKGILETVYLKPAT